MKKILMTVLLCAIAASAQIEPEFPDVFFALVDNKPVALERADITNKVKLTGIGSAKGLIEVPGPASPVRFKSGVLDFIVKMPAPGDPEAQYHIRKLTGTKKTRQVVSVRASAFGGARTNNDHIPATYSKFGESSIKIHLDAIASGEYAIGRPSAQSVFCFGID